MNVLPHWLQLQNVFSGAIGRELSYVIHAQCRFIWANAGEGVEE